MFSFFIIYYCWIESLKLGINITGEQKVYGKKKRGNPRKITV